MNRFLQLKKKQDHPVAAFCLLAGMMLAACNESAVQDPQTAGKDAQAPFYIRTMDSAVVPQMDPALLMSIHESLIQDKRKGDADRLASTYDFGTGMLREGKPLAKTADAPPVDGTPQCYCFGYSAYMQGIGWGQQAMTGETAGTTGQSRRVEDISITRDDGAPAENLIQFNLHRQSIGWGGWKNWGQAYGGAGSGLRVEALKVASYISTYHTWYKAYVQSQGWQDWVHDGAEAGTDGLGLRLEAFIIKIYIY